MASTALRLEVSDVEGGSMPGSGPNIVVGADGSDASAEALRWAIRHAKLIGAEVRVVTGYTYPFTIFLAPTYTEADYERDAAEAQRVTIEKATQGLRDVPLTTTVIQTRPARLLTEMAREADYEREAVEAQRVTIEKATQGLRDVPLTTTVIETRPARLLTEMARDADLLVVGAHGPDGFTGMHLGSVANYCVHHAPCPVVVVRPPID